MFKFFLLISLLFHLSIAWSSSYDEKDFNPEILLQLSENKTWKKLLHYTNSHSSSSNTKSTITSQNFFLDPKGSTNSYAELTATLKGIYEPIDQSSDQHPQCLFPARYLWLDKQLSLNSLSSPPPKINCEAFNQWALNGTTESISVIFATGYLGNPASYYGHTLLKMNSSNQNYSSNLLDISINYGAIVPENEDPVSYVIKGIVGGYDAGFSHIKYHFHTHNYGENELRDLWEYKLNLTQEEVDFVLAHTWEVLGKKYTYYFMNKNCAYRMAELLEIIDGVKITSEEAPWFLPQTVIQRISKIDRNSKPLLADVIYHPSRQSRFYEKYQSLTSNQREHVEKIIMDIDFLKTAKFSNEPIESKHLILDTLLDYYQYLSVGDQSEDSQYMKNYKLILRHRFTLPPGLSKIDKLAAQAPHQGRSPSLLQLSTIDNNILGSGLSLNIRPAYYDSLDSNDSHVKYADLTMASFELAFIDDNLKLRNLDLIKINSLNTKATGLPEDDNSAWRLKVGVNTKNLACKNNCLVANIQADKGYTFSPYKGLLLAGYLGGGLQDNRTDNGNSFAKASGFAILDIHKNIRSILEFEQRHHFENENQTTDIFRFSTRYKIKQNLDIRATYHKNNAEEVNISLGFYW